MNNIILERNDRASNTQLFHFTRIDNLIQIIVKDLLYFGMNRYDSDFNKSNKNHYSLSLSSTPSIYIGYASNWSTPIVRIELDYVKLRNSFKIIPFHYWGGDKDENFEYERRLITKTRYKIDDISSYIKSVDILIDATDEKIEYIINELKKRGIQHAVFDNKAYFSSRQYDKKIIIEPSKITYIPRDKIITRYDMIGICRTLSYILYNNVSIIKNTELIHTINKLPLTNEHVRNIKENIKDIVQSIMDSSFSSFFIQGTIDTSSEESNKLVNILIKDMLYKKVNSNMIDSYLYRKTYGDIDTPNKFKINIYKKLSVEFDIPKLFDTKRLYKKLIDSIVEDLLYVMREIPGISPELNKKVIDRATELVDDYIKELLIVGEQLERNNEIVVKWLESLVK